MMIFSMVPFLGCECGGPEAALTVTVSPEEVEPGGEITVTVEVVPPQETELEIDWLGEELGPFYTDDSGEFSGVLDIEPKLSGGEYDLVVWALELGQFDIAIVTVVGLPRDLGIHYSWGSCHAERGRYELTIYSSGEADFVKSEGHPTAEGYSSEQSEFSLSDQQLLGIYDRIITNDFFGLDEEYRNPDIIDGDCSSLAVKAEGKEHEVVVANREIAPFDRITALLTAILDRKVAYWEVLGEQKLPTSIPGDLEIHYSWGACHGEWGRYELTINASAEADFVKSLGNPMVKEGYFKEQSEFNLSDEELFYIYQEIIIKNNFFGLDEEYRDPEILDGSCSSLSVKAEGKEHKVFVQNRRIARFNRITAKITAILGSKVPDWEVLREQG